MQKHLCTCACFVHVRACMSLNTHVLWRKTNRGNREAIQKFPANSWRVDSRLGPSPGRSEWDRGLIRGSPSILNQILEAHPGAPEGLLGRRTGRPSIYPRSTLCLTSFYPRSILGQSFGKVFDFPVNPSALPLSQSSGPLPSLLPLPSPFPPPHPQSAPDVSYQQLSGVPRRRTGQHAAT